MHAYIVVSLFTGARTEELRALTWNHLDLEGDTKAIPPRPASIQLWRSVRASGETKTKRSRRTLELPALCVDALRQHRHHQLGQRIRMGSGGWITIWCSPLDTAPSSTRRTSGVGSGPLRLPLPCRLRSGHPASCGTV